MGSVVSQEVYSMLDEDPSQSPKSNLRTIPGEFDPRSPTLGVDRTPIQFAATPDQLIDPRSPSYGIDRTPIYSANLPDGSSLDVLSVEEKDEPTRNVAVVPFNLMDAEVESETLGGTDVLAPVPVAPVIDFSEFVPPQGMDFKDAEEQQPVAISTSTQIASEFPKPQVLHDMPKTKALRPMAPFCPSSQRSPLGTRNVQSGSLRSMVQLKEARKAENIMRSSKSPADSLRLRNNGSVIDKENL